MRSMRLLTAAVLAVILALSSAQNVYAAPQIILNPMLGLPGTIVTVTGSGFNVTAQPFCDFVSNPGGLVGPLRGTDFVCNVAGDGSMTGTFTVAAGASGPYSVTVTYFGQTSDPVQFNADGFLVIEVSYSICVVQVGLVQQDGSTMWIGTGVTGAPISDCPNTTEYFTDATGGTVAFHQFILNGTSFKIVPIQPSISI